MTDDQTRPDATDQQPTVVLPAGTAATSVLSDTRVAPYLDACDAALADLPPAERAELLEDLAAHLDEIAAEEGDALSIRLGPPGAYAEEFRASAGYPALNSEARPQPPLRERASTLVHGARLRLVAWIDSLPGGAALRHVLIRLRPAWWFIRAWVAAYLVVGDSLLNSFGFGGKRPFLVLAACLGVSVAWGLRAERARGGLPTVERLVLLGLNATAVLLCYGGISAIGPLAYVGTDGGADLVQPNAIDAPPGLSMGGLPITNLTAFDLEGNPIPAVQLFDQDGNRVVADTSAQLGPNGESVYPVTATDSQGYPTSGVFPITYVVTNDYYDEATGETSLQVSRLLTAQWPTPVAATAGVVPPVGSIVPLDADGLPDWASAQPPAPVGAPSPSASSTAEPTDAADAKDTKGAKD